MGQFLSKKNSPQEIIHNFFNWILLLIFVAIVGLSYMLFLQPAYQKTRTTNDFSLKESQAYLIEQQAYLAKLKSFNKAISSVTAEQNQRLDSVLPKEPKIAELYVMFEDIALKNNLTLESVAVDTPINSQAQAGNAVGSSQSNIVDLGILLGNDSANTTANGAGLAANGSGSRQVVELSVVVTMQGDLAYENYKQLLQTVESSLRLLDLRQITFTPGQDSVTLNMITYYYPSA
ncbi:MAG: hypothetical protein COT81_03745 [Candidatus Buchananbacteria bacterium CG10_big_fil_rev_8_21_14_0_10_42_9]|uniref:Uncharacterized protein n=1 Tax=Candidatus Buchananbacteria bacterium CG10_big_fil_rev_8_21_14_0_10_42_9 TaxID=1974526 RepID=A0A2H0W0R4_9BACT|nr:MAG: hypothetical protein COT81_03745 [Candidatus Buchananbacteria bacterium CG10_big_fil_rev_8_21_14_0_10_42_9]